MRFPSKEIVEQLRKEYPAGDVYKRQVYADDESILSIHDRKLDALEDIIEAANGKTVLVAYWFKALI